MKPTKPLTDRERLAAENQAYQHWLQQQAIYNPPPQPDESDLVQENRKVMDLLVRLVGLLPLLLGVIGVAAAVVSMDKTAAAFEASVAHKNGLWGAWTYIVAFSAIIMVDLALVVAEFALVRDMLKKGLHRRVFNLLDLVKAVRVRLGLDRPLDYHEHRCDAAVLLPVSLRPDHRE